jgi:hypothetical protein
MRLIKTKLLHTHKPQKKVYSLNPPIHIFRWFVILGTILNLHALCVIQFLHQ